ncbi:hypothetical protein DE146DRAFT_459836 [Phaeosphaeria sp. MPI-PUGE-AT-0046c]|nr:hypothetical protein DE146DRAFT_459836 [Phaeosphaeria sp. MPI-PUGE-AT-0046c]
MADNRPFRVIIGGGGIAGLTLANALEKASVDYILLEARDTISPQVGASIGIFPNGGRIIDQLGCFDQIEREICPLGLYYNRYQDGSLAYVADGIPLLQKRLAYPTAFLERETVLKVLYENLTDKSKIKLTKRISQVDHNSKEVIVLCEDGTAVSGDVLVGCDGVHSKVRREIWRLAQSEEPDAFDPKDQGAMMAEYKCLYGISRRTDGINESEVHVNFVKGYSTLIIGSKGKVFWFIFERLDKTYKASDIPRYTKQDAEKFGLKFVSQAITPITTFGDIWNNATSYSLVPTEEAQLKRWTWGRMACVGDSVHKMTPNLGAGGNAAIESAAALANEMKIMMDKSGSKGTPSFGDVKKHLENYQKIRYERSAGTSTMANGLTRIHALQTLKDKLFAFWVIPALGDILIDGNCSMMMNAVKLDYLPIPERSCKGTMLFNPSQGMGKEESKLLRALKALPFLAITATAVHFMWGLALPPMMKQIGTTMTHGIESQIGRPGHLETYQNFYGVEFIDSRVRALAACFTTFQLVDVVSSWQSFTFLTDVGLLYAIMLIEGARRANVATFAYLPLFWAYNMQFMGAGVLMSVYCFLHYVQTPIESFRARDMRLTDMAYTATILPVVVATYYVPNFGSMASFLDPQTRHTWNWIWQPFAVWASIMQFMLKKTIMPNTRNDRIEDPCRDLPTIRFTIGTLCSVSALMWWYTLYSAPVSWATLFIPNIAPGQSGHDSVRLFMQFDQICSFGASFLWLLYLYGDMKKAGMMHNSWTSILLKGVITILALGPGTAVGLGWLHRERILSTRWHKDALMPRQAK